MSFIILILPILKGLSYLLWNHLILLKFLISVLLILLNIYLYKKLPSVRDVHLYAYKIKNMYIPIVFACVYILIFIFLVTAYRIFNLNRVVDLKSLYLHISSLTKSELFINSLLIIFTFTLLVIIYKVLKEKFIAEFTKLHIYLYQYEKYFDFIFEILRYLNIPAYKLFNFLQNNFGIASKYSIKCNTLIDNLGHVVIIIALLYDVIFNMLVITKIYYIFPIAYLYTQVYIYKKFLETRDVLQDIHLSNFYYKKHVRQTFEGVYLENEEFYGNKDIQNLQNYILRNFTPEGLTQTDIIDSK